ncbi:MAG TPA: hypothetical protein VL972_09605 [Solirubrobacteraceae bacterium]|nr:hypothetical protein [Solirubrobacteraceae bacterium]
MAEVLSEDPRYPKGTMFLDVESADPLSILDAIREERTFVIVLPDRTEIALAPRMELIPRLRRRLWWPFFRWRASKPGFVLDRSDGYDISPPSGFTLHLHRPAPAG